MCLRGDDQRIADTMRGVTAASYAVMWLQMLPTCVQWGAMWAQYAGPRLLMHVTKLTAIAALLKALIEASEVHCDGMVSEMFDNAANDAELVPLNDPPFDWSVADDHVDYLNGEGGASGPSLSTNSTLIPLL